ncbi:MAG: glycosyltransferase [Balneolales bacterium]
MKKKQLRIAFFVGSFPHVSETFIMNQITGLIDRGHIVDIFASRYVNGIPLHDDVHKYGLIDKTHYLNLPRNFIIRLLKLIYMIIFFGGWKKPLTLAKTLNIRKYGRSALSLALASSAVPLINKKPYDILHCQFGWLGPRVLTLKEINAVSGKLIVAFRGADITRSLNSNHGIYDQVFKKADSILPVSNSLKQKLLSEGCSADKIIIHHSGIDCSRFKFKECIKDKDSVTNLITIGRLVEKKGIAYAIRAISEIVNLGYQLKYTIIGDGILMGELKKLIQVLDLNKHVTLVGSKSSDDVISYLEKAHIFIAPSIQSKSGDCEGIPNSSKEAMAMGVPVLTTFHSGNPELIEDGVSGFMVPEGDVNALADRLKFLIDHPEIWPETGRAGREVIETKFDMNKLNDELIHVYYEIAESKHVYSSQSITQFSLT